MGLQPNNDTTLLDPVFWSKLYLAISDARNSGLNVYIFEGFRTLQRQQFLYGKGRSAWSCRLAGVPVVFADPSARVVTWTMNSKHLLGKAADIVFDVSKDSNIRVPSWSGDYSTLTKIMANY